MTAADAQSGDRDPDGPRTRDDGDVPSAWHDDDGLGWRLAPLGPAAWRLVADAEPSAELSRRLAAVRTRALAAAPPILRDLLVGYRTLTAELRPGAGGEAVARALAAATGAAESPGDPGASVTLPVDYGDAADRTELEASLGLAWPALVARHAAAAYRVAFLGFTPGFAYLHGLPPELSLPRRASPRTLPAGAVAIADGRAGVYPAAGPGGWWVLGTTPTQLFDPWRASPTALLPGDAVRFRPIGPGDAGPPSAAGGTARSDPPAGPAAASGDAALVVVEAWPGGATLQGRPRHGVGHLGMAQAGALDPRAFAAAAHLAGAPLSAPALEFLVPHATLRAVRRLVAAAAGGGARLRLEGRDLPIGRPFVWPAGQHLEVRPAPGGGTLTVLAVGGGLVPLSGAVGHRSLVGEGSTDVRAGVGGFGRPLRAGDVLALAAAPLDPDPAWSGRWRFPQHLVLRLHPGPHAEDVAFEALLARPLRLAARDRMGARLDGTRIVPERADVASEGVPAGAVQLPADGRPIVLLADRGRTGGYAIAAVVDPRDLRALAQARPGSAITFRRYGAPRTVGYDGSRSWTIRSR